MGSGAVNSTSENQSGSANYQSNAGTIDITGDSTDDQLASRILTAMRNPHSLISQTAQLEGELAALLKIPKSKLTPGQLARLNWLKRWKGLRMRMMPGTRGSSAAQGMWRARVAGYQLPGRSNLFGSRTTEQNTPGGGNGTGAGQNAPGGGNGTGAGQNAPGSGNGTESGSQLTVSTRTGSLSDMQRTYDQIVGRHQEITDRADVLTTAPLQPRSDTFSSTAKAGMTDASTFSVSTNPGDGQSQQSQPGGFAGNPAQQNMLGFTWAAFPNEAQSHFGPPNGSEGPIFQYYPGYNADVGSRFASQANAGSAYQSVNPVNQSQITDTACQLTLQAMEAKFVDQFTSPGRWTHGAGASVQSMQEGAGNAAAGAAQSTFEGAINQIGKGLLNIANEGATQPCDVRAPIRTLSQAGWMVQQMFRSVYLPVAILLLLPGVLLTQTKGLLKVNILNEGDDDAFGPFAGILRSVIAVFLIPATQLMVSYSVDIGNSMTFEIQQFLNRSEIVQWAQAQNDQQSAQPTGPAAEEQTTMEQTRNRIFNFINMALGFGLTVLIGFQTIMICYLYLLGPIAAAFFAWPSGQRMFKPIFSNWLNAVTHLTLWRFWWCLIVLCMCTRIEWLKEIGQYDPASPWEGIMFTAFLVLLTYVPFAAFEFRPGDLVEQMLQKAGKGSAGGGGSGGGSQGDGGTGGTPPGNPSAPPTQNPDSTQTTTTTSTSQTDNNVATGGNTLVL